jgi:hypothetical protein
LRPLRGEVAEWLKAHAWKACVRLKPYRGFESRSLRHRSLMRSISVRSQFFDPAAASIGFGHCA